MTEIDRLNELQETRKNLAEQWKNQRLTVTKKLYEMLELLNQGPLPIFYTEDSIVNIDDYDYPEKEGFKWRVSKEIYFKDPEKPEKYDFGSSFSLTITNLAIKVNMGSCGSWGLENKGQWSRILLVKKIFDHQDDFIRELDPLINLSVSNELWKTGRAIDQINQDIRRAKEERELNEIKKLLKPNKYLAILGQRYVWDGDHTGHYENYYHTFEKIEKITEVSVFTHDVSNSGQEYTWVTHRRKLSQVLRDLQFKSLKVIDDINEKAPQKEEKK